MAENPYSAGSSTSLTDTILIRSFQLLLFLAASWFLYLMLAINDPELAASLEQEIQLEYDGTGESGTGNSGNLRGPQLPQQLPPEPVDPADIKAAKEKIQQFRHDFYMRYGGEQIATEMLHKGLHTFEKKHHHKNSDESSIHFTANRFLSTIVRHETDTEPILRVGMDETVKRSRAEFVMAFAGYSVTVGRGNHLEQSYPFVLEQLLSPILALPPLDIKLVVRNSAIGGIPSFPYGWCLTNFLGDDADLVSWDYGMNEGNGASGLESYVRQSLAMMPKSPPLFMLLDKKRPRLDLLQKYVDLGVLPDPVALGGRDAVDKKLLELPENDKPPGLQQWNEWGAPKGAPGQSPWHPKKKEHELMGWMLAMHMLDAVDVALDKMQQNADWRNTILEQERRRLEVKERILPKPITDVSNTGAASILHGTTSESDASKWHMNHISCRTSFLPNISGDLKSIIESGVTADNEDMLNPRDDALFEGGWVMDVGKLERDTKLKVQKYGGLGYIDMKTALYGIPSSGTLKLWLPYETRSSTPPPDSSASASKYFNSIVICEVNEKRGDKECNMLSNVSFRVGGVDVSSQRSVSQVKGVASYLKKDICIRLQIPEEAKLRARNNGLGVDVAVTVTGTGVTREDGACSISHVIWENL